MMSKAEIALVLERRLRDAKQNCDIYKVSFFTTLLFRIKEYCDEDYVPYRRALQRQLITDSENRIDNG